MNSSDAITQAPPKIKLLIIGICFTVGLIYFFSNPQPQNYYDYTFRVAENIWRGAIGFGEKPPSWLNEFVPSEGSWYSVFPLGSVVTMLPFALLKIAGLISEMPAALISALSASVICLFLFLISLKYDYSFEKLILLVLSILFGTWMWVNETMAGAWQLALGFAMIGELGAIYFSIYHRQPLFAGLFFALAFGNRTEILLTAPVFIALLFRNSKPNAQDSNSAELLSASFKNISSKKLKMSKVKQSDLPTEISNLKSEIFSDPKFALRTLVTFCAFPLILGSLTLIYNYVRFHSFTDFGYARIPGVLNEPWYDHGIFSVYYIPRQAYEMLFKSWEIYNGFPYLAPEPFSSSILWSSPFLLLLLRFGGRDKILKYAAWTAILILTILLWMHGNSGGYQFGYRYAMILLPWVFVILLENSPRKITVVEAAAYTLSFLLNIYAVYLFYWTDYLKR